MANEITIMMDVRRNLISIQNICLDQMDKIWAECRKFDDTEFIPDDFKRKSSEALKRCATCFNDLTESGTLYQAYEKDLDKIKQSMSVLSTLMTSSDPIKADTVARLLAITCERFQTMYFVLSGEELKLSTLTKCKKEEV